jgi:hypothetical protein
MLSAKIASLVQCPPRGLHREQTLGEGFGERKGSFTERNPTLGEDLESGSVWRMKISMNKRLMNQLEAKSKTLPQKSGFDV